MKDQPLKIRGITESLRDDVLAGRMTIEAAAIELNKSGWSTCIDIDKTRKLLIIPTED